jgi:hypothetical protein
MDAMATKAMIGILVIIMLSKDTERKASENMISQVASMPPTIPTSVLWGTDRISLIFLPDFLIFK